MKSKFKLIEYNNIPYPEGYICKIKEVAGHLDKEEIEDKEVYSLHTEYSYGKRKFNSQILEKYPTLKESNKDGVPQLWKNEKWAEEFADFIIELTSSKKEPHIIEIHPPFSDYTDLNEFVGNYKIFENRIKEVYFNAKIFIENRAGAVYRGGKFIISKAEEVASLCNLIEENNLQLGIVLDFPQLLTAEHIDTLNFNVEKYNIAIEKIYPYQHLINGIHIWGKKKNPKGRWIAHCGNLDTFFDNNTVIKKIFINGIKRICDDGATRFLVPEVNSGEEDLRSVVEDILTI